MQAAVCLIAHQQKLGQGAPVIFHSTSTGNAEHRLGSCFTSFHDLQESSCKLPSGDVKGFDQSAESVQVSECYWYCNLVRCFCALLSLLLLGDQSARLGPHYFLESGGRARNVFWGTEEVFKTSLRRAQEADNAAKSQASL